MTNAIRSRTVHFGQKSQTKNRIHGPACERGRRTATTPPRRRRAAARSAAHAPAVVPERDGAIRSINPAWTQAPAHIAGLISARAPAKGTLLKNVRQTLTMAAITGVLAAAPLTLSNATAFAADDMRWDPNTVGAPFEAADFMPAPPAPAPDAPAPDAAPAADAPAPDAPPPPADLPPARLLMTRPRRPRLPSGRTASTGTRSLPASPVATGRSAPVTATPVACSSRPAPGGPTVARDPRTARAARSRSGWPRTCCTARASAPGRSAADAADQRKQTDGGGRAVARHRRQAFTRRCFLVRRTVRLAPRSRSATDERASGVGEAALADLDQARLVG
jgi:hypothetical protein